MLENLKSLFHNAKCWVNAKLNFDEEEVTNIKKRLYTEDNVVTVNGKKDSAFVAKCYLYYNTKDNVEKENTIDVQYNLLIVTSLGHNIEVTESLEKISKKQYSIKPHSYNSKVFDKCLSELKRAASELSKNSNCINDSILVEEINAGVFNNLYVEMDKIHVYEE